jgi:MFS family permease
MPLYLVFTVAFFGFTSITAGRVVLSLYVLKLGAEPLAIGMLASTFYVVPMLMAWLVGRASDRFGSRWPLTLSAACGAIGMALPFFVQQLPALYVAAALLGMSFVCNNVPLQNAVGIISGPTERTRNFSNFSLVGAVTNFVGPVFAGFSIDHSGHAVASVLTAALPLASVAVLLTMGGVLPRGSVRARAKAEGTKAGFFQPGVAANLVTSSIVVVGLDLYQFYLPVYAHSINLSASATGIVLGAFAAASFVVRVFMQWLVDHMSESRLLAYSFCIAAASIVLIPFYQDTVMLSVISFVFGLGMGLGQPLTIMLMFTSAAEGRSGEALGVRVTANNFSRAVVPAVFGVVGSAFGLAPLFWLNAVLLGAGAMLARSEPDHRPKK